MEEKLYNVYAWYKKSDGRVSSALRVGEGLNISRANDMVDAYLNRKDTVWDAYIVEQSDDPGWARDLCRKKANKPVFHNAFEEFVQDISAIWEDQMPMLCIEELSELIRVISKCERNYKEDDYVVKVIDEMGDAFISIWALAHHYGISRKDIERRVNYYIIEGLDAFRVDSRY